MYNKFKRIAIFFEPESLEEAKTHINTLDLSDYMISFMTDDVASVDYLRTVNCICLDFCNGACESYDKDIEMLFDNVCHAPEGKVLFIGTRDEDIYNKALSNGYVVEIV